MIPAMPVALAWCSLALIAISIAAFWPTYLSLPAGGIDRYTHLHALVGTLWMLLLLAQPILIAMRRHAAHRALGKTSWLLAPLFVVSSVLLAHFRFSHKDEATFVAEAYTLYLPLTATALFAAAYAQALRWRRDPALHARFMACTGLLLVDPVGGRALAFHVVELPQFWHYQIITFSVEALVLAALVATLAAGSAARRTFLRFALAFAVVQALWFVIPHTRPWFEFADAFRKFPLT